jgi:outer membrane biosynthesis protein TonB
MRRLERCVLILAIAGWVPSCAKSGDAPEQDMVRSSVTSSKPMKAPNRYADIVTPSPEPVEMAKAAEKTEKTALKGSGLSFGMDPSAQVLGDSPGGADALYASAAAPSAPPPVAAKEQKADEVDDLLGALDGVAVGQSSTASGSGGLGLRGTGSGGGGEGFGRIHGMGRIDTGGGRGARAPRAIAVEEAEIGDPNVRERRAQRRKKKRPMKQRVRVANRSKDMDEEFEEGEELETVVDMPARKLIEVFGGKKEEDLRLDKVGTKGKSPRNEGYGRGAGELGGHTTPQVVAGKPTILGALSKEIIRRIIRRHRNEVRYCYERALNRVPGLAGKLVVKMVIGADGAVVSARTTSSTMGAPIVARCIERKIENWRFPAPKGGGMVVVNYPFLLRPGSKVGGKSMPTTRTPEPDPEAALRFQRPAKFLPRMSYFENTYLGGNAAYIERLRRLNESFSGATRPYLEAHLADPVLDAPADAGLALTATLDQTWVDRPQRVFLQIGLQGSRRYGWRRPPLDVALVVDGPALAAGNDMLSDAVEALIRRLGPQDRLGVVLAGKTPQLLADMAGVQAQRVPLGRSLEALGAVPTGAPQVLRAALDLAGARLRTAANDQARIPGTQLVLLLTKGSDPQRVAAATAAAHGLTLQGAVTSVIDLAGSADWWQVANAGHGNLHRVEGGVADVIEAELQSVAKVIARLLRINIRLAPDVEAVRIIGSRVLNKKEVARVKAREEATDRNLSRTLGVTADRGDDDDGIQTVIPYFYGDDAHVILVELWVAKPGPVAEVTLKFKDMVKLENATSRTSTWLANTQRAVTPAIRLVRRNLQGFRIAEALEQAAAAARRNDTRRVMAILDELSPRATGRDASMLAGFRSLVNQRGGGANTAAAFEMARERRLGASEGP